LSCTTLESPVVGHRNGVAQPLMLQTPWRFDASRSGLGMMVSALVPDRRRAGSVFYVVLGLYVAAVLFVLQWMGLLLPDAIGGMQAFGGQLLLGLVAAGIGFIGWRRPLTVFVNGMHLCLRRGDVLFEVPLSTVRSFQRVPAVEVHRHWARYEAVRLFQDRPTDDALLLRLDDDTPVIIALPEVGLDQLEQALDVLEVPSLNAGLRGFSEAA